MSKTEIKKPNPYQTTPLDMTTLEILIEWAEQSPVKQVKPKELSAAMGEGKNGNLLAWLIVDESISRWATSSDESRWLTRVLRQIATQDYKLLGEDMTNIRAWDGAFDHYGAVTARAVRSLARVIVHVQEEQKGVEVE